MLSNEYIQFKHKPLPGRFWGGKVAEPPGKVIKLGEIDEREWGCIGNVRGEVRELDFLYPALSLCGD